MLGHCSNGEKHAGNVTQSFTLSHTASPDHISAKLNNSLCVCECTLSLSRVQLFATLRAYGPSGSSVMGFPR